MSDPEANPSPKAPFPTTRWSRVARAGDPAGARGAARPWPSSAAAYWYPLYAFIRRQGYRPDEAADLTQDYFARLLEKGTARRGRPPQGPLPRLPPHRLRLLPGRCRDHAGPGSAAAGRRCSRSTPATPRAATCASRPTPDARPALRPRLGRCAARPRPGAARRRVRRLRAGRTLRAPQAVLTARPRSVPYAMLAARLGMTEAAVAGRRAPAPQALPRRAPRGDRRHARRPDEAAVEEEIRDLFAALEAVERGRNRGPAVTVRATIPY